MKKTLKSLSKNLEELNSKVSKFVETQNYNEEDAQQENNNNLIEEIRIKNQEDSNNFIVKISWGCITGFAFASRFLTENLIVKFIIIFTFVFASLSLIFEFIETLIARYYLNILTSKSQPELQLLSSQIYLCRDIQQEFIHLRDVFFVISFVLFIISFLTFLFK